MTVPLQVLIVEDAPDDAELMVQELRRAGFEPLWQRVETEPEYLARLHPHLDVILSDYSLPQFDAPRALCLLKERGYDVPFIVVTGTVSEGVAVECIKHGAADCLLKDRLARLGQAVAQALERKQAQVERQQAEAALRESEEKYRTLFETMAQGVVYHDATGKIISANPAAEMILGLPIDQMQGRTSCDPRWKAMHEDGSNFPAEMHPAMVALKTGTAVKNVVMGVFNPVDNARRWLLLSAVPQFRAGEDKPYQVYTTFQDISRRKQVEERLHRYAERLQNLLEVDQAVLEARTPEEIADAALIRLRRQVSCRRASVAEFDFEADEGVILAAQVDGETQWGPGARYPLIGDEYGNTEALRNGKVLQVEDSLSLAEPTAVVQRLQTEGLRSYIGVPLVTPDGLIGCLYLVSDRPNAFDKEQENLAREVADRLALAIQHARLFQQVRAGREELHALSQRLMDAQEAERRHIAHELHDEIGQALTALNINLHSAKSTPDDAVLTSILDQSIGLVERTLQQVRELSRELRPAMLDELGLVTALQAHVNSQAQRMGLTMHFVADLAAESLPAHIEIACFRVAQEALTNIARHAGAQQVEVELYQRDDQLELVIRDDGVGFDVRAARERAVYGASLGLLSMEERVQLAGGRMVIHSTPSASTALASTPGGADKSGTEIRARFPLAAPPTLHLLPTKHGKEGNGEEGNR